MKLSLILIKNRKSGGRKYKKCTKKSIENFKYQRT